MKAPAQFQSKLDNQALSSAQDLQDEIFRRMSAEEKIKAAADLTMFCLKLNRLKEEKEK